MAHLGRCSDEEQEYRLQEILDLFKKGHSKREVSKIIRAKYDIGFPAMTEWFKKSFEYLKQDEDDFIKNVRNLQVERIEKLIKETFDKEDRKNAVAALDLLNKTLDMYVDKHEISMKGDIIKFQFNNDDNTPETENKEVESSL